MIVIITHSFTQGLTTQGETIFYLIKKRRVWCLFEHMCRFLIGGRQSEGLVKIQKLMKEMWLGPIMCISNICTEIPSLISQKGGLVGNLEFAF